MKLQWFARLLLFFVIGLSGCTYLRATFESEKQNLGIVDSRIIFPDQTGNHITDLNQRYFSPNQENIKPFIIDKGSSITITLQQGFIADFYEPWDWASGEIAIVGRVRELKDDTKISFAKNASETGRLIYYSDDVRQGFGEITGQPLNFSSLPLYGPAKYNGGPLLIELYIIEMDEEEGTNYKDLIKSLAALGSTAYPAASPVLGVLESLGTALLTGAQNDREFQYHTVLWPADNIKKLNIQGDLYQSYLYESDMVFVKQDHYRPTRWPENQTPAIKPIKWSDMKFNRKSGRLVYIDSEKDYDKHTYLSLKITKVQDSTGVEIAETYYKLGDLIESIDDNSARNAAIDDAVTKLKALIDGQSN